MPQNYKKFGKLWLTAQLVKYIMRPTVELSESIAAIKDAIGFQTPSACIWLRQKFKYNFDLLELQAKQGGEFKVQRPKLFSLKCFGCGLGTDRFALPDLPSILVFGFGLSPTTTSLTYPRP